MKTIAKIGGISLIASACLFADSSSANYKLTNSSFDSGGVVATSANYVNFSSLGQYTAVGSASSTNYASTMGFFTYREVAAPDTTAPTLSSVGVSGVTGSLADINATSNEDGTMYYVVTTNSSTPTVSQIRNGLNNSGSAAVSSGNSAVTAATAKLFNVSGLSPVSTYYYYVVAKDASDNNSSIASGSFSSSQVSQSITFAALGAQNFGTTPTLSASSSSGLTPVFTSSTTSVCTVTSGGALTLVAAGSCTINADQAGNTSFSAASTVSRSFTVNAVVPSAPTSPSASAGDTQATVSFSAPTSSGGAAITGYMVTSTPGGFTGTGASSPITVTGLTNGTAYTFTVTATNSAGTSPASSATTSVTPASGSSVLSVAVNSDATYKVGDNLDFTVTWDSNVVVTGTPRLAITLGSTTVYANYVSSPTATTNLFRYTVQSGDADTNGITVGVLSLNGGSIKNGSSIDGTLALNSVGNTTAILVDAQGPILSAVSSNGLTSTTANITATSDENATVYYVVTTSSSAPSSSQVLAGKNESAVNALKSGNGSATAATAKTFNVSGLTAATQYYYYIAAKDALLNTSAVYEGNFTTNPPLSFSWTLQAGKWNMASVPDANKTTEGNIAGATGVAKVYKYSDAAGYSQLATTSTTEINATAGLWIKATGTTGTTTVTVSSSEETSVPLTAMKANWKALEGNKWYLLGVSQDLAFPSPTDANILNGSCSTFAIWNYNASSTMWNTSATVPAKSAVWLQHFCN